MNFSKAVLFATAFLSVAASAAQSDRYASAPLGGAREAGSIYVGPRDATDAAGAAVNSAPSPMTTTWVEKQMTWPADGKAFGTSVAINGTTAFVGAPGQDSGKGAVYVMLHNVCIGSVCSWGNSQKLVAADGVANDAFGGNIAFDGTTLLVGAAGATVNGHAQQGAVYIFRKSGSTWTQVQKLVDSAGSAQDSFGVAVAIAGTDAIVGAPFATINGATSRGAAYRYSADKDGNWTLSQKLLASDGVGQEEFGYSVAIKNGTALVGALTAYQYGYWGVGAVYIYDRQCFTDGCNPGWLETQKLVASPATTEMAFGTSIAFDGTTVLVGAEWALTGPENVPVFDQLITGAAYVFTKANGVWTQTQRLVPADADRNWRFGASVALDGNKALFGSTGAGWPDMRGGAYVFERSGTTWSQTQKILASNATTNDYFGLGVGLSGSLMLIGAPQGPNNTGRGTVYYYEGSCSGLCGM